VRQEWSDVFFQDNDPDLQSDVGFFLGRLDCLINSEFAVWATIDEAVEYVMEWRFEWPRQDDPAFGPIDLILNSSSLMH
jgi:hypothetical protein